MESKQTVSGGNERSMNSILKKEACLLKVGEHIQDYTVSTTEKIDVFSKLIDLNMLQPVFPEP